jgi:hypothetical protein
MGWCISTANPRQAARKVSASAGGMLADGQHVHATAAAVANLGPRGIHWHPAPGHPSVRERLRCSVPLEYVLDHARQRLTIIGRDPVDVPDELAWLERQLADGAWAYGTLDDLRLVTWNPTSEEVRRILRRIGMLSATHGPRGPVAIVATQPLFDRARTYAASLGALLGHEVDVFYELADAERWLDERQAAKP